MSGTTNKGAPHVPMQARARAKAEATDEAARAIIDAEAERREAKTARLKQARLAQEAATVAKPAKKPPARASKAKSRPA